MIDGKTRHYITHFPYVTDAIIDTLKDHIQANAWYAFWEKNANARTIERDRANNMLFMVKILKSGLRPLTTEPLDGIEKTILTLGLAVFELMGKRASLKLIERNEYYFACRTLGLTVTTSNFYVISKWNGNECFWKVPSFTHYALEFNEDKLNELLAPSFIKSYITFYGVWKYNKSPKMCRLKTPHEIFKIISRFMIENYKAKLVDECKKVKFHLCNHGSNIY